MPTLLEWNLPYISYSASNSWKSIMVKILSHKSEILNKSKIQNKNDQNEDSGKRLSCLEHLDFGYLNLFRI